MKQWILVLMVALVCCSCGEKVHRKPVFPVTGVILVDNKPVQMLAVRCANVAGIDKADPTISSAFTDEAGKFQISTFNKGDGVPEGEYVLTFEWGTMNLISMQYGGPDKLKGKYSDPKTSQVKFTVTAGMPTDLGTINLTTK